MTSLEFVDDDSVQGEVAHYFSDNLLVTSFHPSVFVRGSSYAQYIIDFPSTKFDALGWSRLARRDLALYLGSYLVTECFDQLCAWLQFCRYPRSSYFFIVG